MAAGRNAVPGAWGLGQGKHWGADLALACVTDAGLIQPFTHAHEWQAYVVGLAGLLQGVPRLPPFSSPAFNSQHPACPSSLACVQMKMPQLMPQAEAFLLQLAQGVDGRLHPYHARVIGELPLQVPALQAEWFLAKICLGVRPVCFWPGR